jgi:hypothetical protein
VNTAAWEVRWSTGLDGQCLPDFGNGLKVEAVECERSERGEDEMERRGMGWRSYQLTKWPLATGPTGKRALDNVQTDDEDWESIE